MLSDFNVKVVHATKWSSITEVLAKLFSPISTMILARLLTPEAFGVVATITMVIAFAELFTDAGFQKYLIQQEFESDDDLIKNTNVAFLTNLFLSIILCCLIIVFRDWIAMSLGNDKLGLAIGVACISIPLSAFSSIQTALFKRDFDFKTLFTVRTVSLIIPLLITIPLALLYRNYWALIFGTLSLKLVNAIYLTYKSRWKPKLFYNFKIFKQMLSFTLWTIVESVFIWLSSYVGILIVGLKLNVFYLGLYQASMTLVVQIITIGVSAITPVLFSTLSRLQGNEGEFKRIFLLFQGAVAFLVIPLGLILFSYRHFITLLFLGDQWGEATEFVGLLGLTTAFTIVYSHLYSEVFRAKGKPKLSLLLQLSFLFFFIPSISVAVNYGFKTLYITHSLLQLIMIIIGSFMMYYIYKISLLDMLRGTAVKIIVGLLMFFISLILRQVSTSFYWDVLSIVFCALFYFGVLCSIKKEREFLLKLKTLFFKGF
ncbi:lipopolysaccharide biosynthesis protein [Flavobacteriaceae bacterium]|nr:lipopolysaccharide biosynthesis protein [Flavobacteriaceae bacterium]